MSSHQAAPSSMSGVPVVPGGAANHSRDRNDEHDSQGTGEVDSERRHRRTSHVRRSILGLTSRLPSRQTDAVYAVGFLLQHYPPAVTSTLWPLQDLAPLTPGPSSPTSTPLSKQTVHAHPKTPRRDTAGTRAPECSRTTTRIPVAY